MTPKKEQCRQDILTYAESIGMTGEDAEAATVFAITDAWDYPEVLEAAKKILDRAKIIRNTPNDILWQAPPESLARGAYYRLFSEKRNKLQ